MALPEKRTKRVVFKKDGYSREYPWSYHIKYSDGGSWLTFGFKTKQAARRDYHKQKKANFI